ncbi:MAG: ribonuclease E inhibitor RraB [Helicobacteraceae bacterium]|jgi:tetratricopeptide (TPR) repeat protein|nr:ribonuclease E inhibitor RraB [Helicobacteraceae bacterium]
MDAINTIFDSLEIQGVNTKQEFLYGYFFYDASKSKLEKLKQTLIEQTYSVVEIKKNGNVFALRAEKIEQHTRESIFAAKQNLTKLAERFGVSYDGFDMGDSDPTKPLISNDNFHNFMNTRNEDELFQLGVKLYDFEIYDKAEIVFRECLKKNINPDTVSYKLGNILSRRGAIEEGIKYLEEATKLNPNFLDAWFNLGAICYDNDLFEASIKYYQEADKLHPNDEDIIYGIAAAQFALRQFDQSLKNCKRALEINKKNENAKNLLKMLKNK